MFLVLGLLPTLLLAAPGSFVVELPAVRVAVPERNHVTAGYTPPNLARNEAITRVAWSYQPPAGQALRARLCSGTHCVAIRQARGVSDDLAGHPAGQPLQLQFRLPAGQRRAVWVRNIRLTVAYGPADKAAISTTPAKRAGP